MSVENVLGKRTLTLNIEENLTEIPPGCIDSDGSLNLGMLLERGHSEDEIHRMLLSFAFAPVSKTQSYDEAMKKRKITVDPDARGAIPPAELVTPMNPGGPAPMDLSEASVVVLVKESVLQPE